MSFARYSICLAALVVLPATAAAQPQVRMTAALVVSEGVARVDDKPVATLAAPLVLSSLAVVETTQGRAAIALKRGGWLFLDANSSVRVRDNGAYNFNRIEVLSGSVIVMSGPSSPAVVCENEVRLSNEGISRFDMQEPMSTGERECRLRVFEGAASVTLASLINALRAGQAMMCDRRCGDMIPTREFARDQLDSFDQWARRTAERLK